ncbi:T9SS type A sorting domain-containing protein [candidate division KSB1 bacterium]|nr:T9SS type A sorting domain-containing protein [candidate division KSB1 bacterium]
MKNQRILACIAVCLLIVSATVPSFSREDFWQQANGPHGGTIKSLATNSGGDIFAGTEMNIYRSTDNGASWMRLDVRSSGFKPRFFYTLAINASGHIFAGTLGDGVFRSIDNGDHWTKVSTGLPDYTVVSAMEINHADHIYIGTYEGVYRSTDNGDQWNAINNGLTQLSIKSLAINSSDHVFVGTDEGMSGSIFRSTDNGGTWKEINTGLSDDQVEAIAINSHDHLFIDCRISIYRSTDNGDSWTEVKWNVDCRALAINSNDHIFAGSSTFGIFRSTNHGESWSQVNSGLPITEGVYDDFCPSVNTLAVNSNGDILAGLADGAGIFRSTNNGNTWTEGNVGITDIVVNEFAAQSSGTVFAVTLGGIFRSIDKGTNWQKIDTGLKSEYGYNYSTNTIAVNSTGELFTGTAGSGVFCSINNGDAWQEINNGLADEYGYFPQINALAINSSDHIFAGTEEGFSGSIFRSIDNGENWTEVNNGLMDDEVLHLAVSSNGCIFAGTERGYVFRSTDNGDSWTQVAYFNNVILSLAISPDGDIFAGVEYTGIYRSTDNGDNWDLILGSADEYYLPIAFDSKGHIYMSAEAEGVFHSADNGDDWHEVNTGLTVKDVKSLYIDSNDYLYAGTNGGGVFRSKMPTTAVEKAAYSIPTSFSLNQNYPNPFNASTIIRFSLPREGFVSLNVFNALGEKVASLISGKLEIGVHQVQWNAAGLASGVYYYRLQAGQFNQVKKLVLIK